ncbi:tonB-system energizer ExbB [Agrobacterium sp. a22-2]|uniref:tonB-system energizer ExbB n=1 Tax=Agrobacterium sp. a22-2 TaxID=2283840 RepID=UPI001447B798|nr:tonB-system energizer ExbB [Agrobacterium sp. a22-2]NKN39223.1 tonB-system energizer ExbB [Agrobacterium sp. a22-2]
MIFRSQVSLATAAMLALLLSAAIDNSGFALAQETAPAASVPAAPTAVVPAPVPTTSETPAVATPTTSRPVAVAPSAVPSGTATPGEVPATPALPAAQSAPAQDAVQAAPASPQTAPGTSEPAPSTEPQAPASDAVAAEPAGGMFSDLIEIPRSDLPHDLSPIGMFLAADWVVKSVMIALAFASFLTWTILIAKTLQMAGAKARAQRGLKTVRNAKTLGNAVTAMGRRRGVVALMLATASQELQFSDQAIDHAGGDGVKERVGSALTRIEVQAGRHMANGTGILATIGSTAPFVGLFGTVWGIMNSFIGISESQTTNLAVVAPGIAEALLATAIGLVAAIPAVVIYNVFARSVTGYRQILADAAAGVERLVSRDLDFRKVPTENRAAKIKLVTE